MNVFVILFLVVSVVVLLKFRSSSVNSGSTGRAKAVTNRKIPGRDVTVEGGYSAVTINPAGQACEAVQAFKGERFLVGETPHLPVLGCTSPNCDCKYTHHSERRDDADRRSPFARGLRSSQEGSEESERRERRLRRESDVSPEGDSYDQILDADQSV